MAEALIKTTDNDVSMYLLMLHVANNTGDVGCIIRYRVSVPSRSFREAIKATGRTVYEFPGVLDAVPEESETGERFVYFLRPPTSWFENGLMSYQRAGEFLDCFGLEPDPHGAASVNEADPSFTNQHLHGTQWKDRDGKYCYAAFYPMEEERSVSVDRACDTPGWDPEWFIVARSKNE